MAHSEWAPANHWFLRAGNRCPVHGVAPHQAYKHPPHGTQLESNRLPSVGDLHEYGLPAPHYLSRPYGYLYSDGQYLTPYPHYYSSHMYLPGSYLSMPYLGANMYPSKHLPPSYQQRRSHSFEYNNSMRLYPERGTGGNKCKGHLIVLAIILTVITIGVVMGILLAVSIN